MDKTIIFSNKVLFKFKELIIHVLLYCFKEYQGTTFYLELTGNKY